MTPVLSARGLGWRVAARRGTPALRIVERVSFDLCPGQFVALMGRNGAGKSTVMDLLAGLRRPHEGAVLLDGRSLQDWPARARARRIGHLPQGVRADSPMSAAEIVMMGRYPHAGGWAPSDADRAAVARAMHECGCARYRDRPLRTLSGGERQRVLLAACIAQEPAVLLLDEPSTFLDVDQQLQSFALLRDIVARGGACIAVTHDINLALTFCSRVIVLAERTIARDMDVRTAAEDDGWLGLFSPRLRRVAVSQGRSWVAYR
jgi:ABC-type cobalamin/Fe3+-siderophores transport system ATPase subunit